MNYLIYRDLYDLHKFWKSTENPNNSSLKTYISQIDSAKTKEEHTAVMERLKSLKGQFGINNLTFVKAYDRYLSLKSD